MSDEIDFDAELSRFEQEIQSCAPVPAETSTPAFTATISKPPTVGSKPSFIPNSIRRQIPPPPSAAAAKPLPKPTLQATFVPAVTHTSANSYSSSYSASPSFALSHSSSSGNHSTYTVTPMEIPSVVHNVGKVRNAPVSVGNTMSVTTPGTSSGGVTKAKNNDSNKKGNKKQKKNLRTAGGQTWIDPTLEEWDANDFRIFCGDLGNDVGDDILTKAFNRFTSFVKAKVVRDKKTNKSRGYGFVSFRDPLDFARAIKEMDGKYVGSRPIKLRKSNWQDRNLDVVKQKKKMKQKLGLV